MSKAKDTKKETAMPKMPPVGLSKFSGNKSNFGAINNQKFAAKAQFTPPAIRVTQNKGGGGK